MIAMLASKKSHLQFKTHLDLFIWGFMGQNKDIFLENDVEIQFLEYYLTTPKFYALGMVFWQISKYPEGSLSNRS